MSNNHCHYQENIYLTFSRNSEANSSEQILQVQLVKQHYILLPVPNFVTCRSFLIRRHDIVMFLTCHIIRTSLLKDRHICNTMSHIHGYVTHMFSQMLSALSEDNPVRLSLNFGRLRFRILRTSMKYYIPLRDDYTLLLTICTS